MNIEVRTNLNLSCMGLMAMPGKHVSLIRFLFLSWPSYTLRLYPGLSVCGIGYTPYSAITHFIVMDVIVIITGQYTLTNHLR